MGASACTGKSNTPESRVQRVPQSQSESGRLRFRFIDKGEHYAKAKAETKSVTSAPTSPRTSQNAVCTRDPAPLCCCFTLAEFVALAAALLPLPVALLVVTVTLACFEPLPGTPVAALAPLVPAGATVGLAAEDAEEDKVRGADVLEDAPL